MRMMGVVVEGESCRAARADGEGRGEELGGQWGASGLSDRRPSLTVAYIQHNRPPVCRPSAAHPPPICCAVLRCPALPVTPAPQTPSRPANFVPFRPQLARRVPCYLSVYLSSCLSHMHCAFFIITTPLHSIAYTARQMFLLVVPLARSNNNIINEKNLPTCHCA